MHLRALKRFLAVAELGSINKAAAHLNVSQPSLSKDIQDLEAELGISVFLRSARGVSLTPFGQNIFTRAKLVDAEFRKLEAEVQALRGVSIGEVHVGVVPGFLQTRVLPTATLNLTRDARSLSVNYRFGTRGSLLQPLLRGDLDFVIVGIEDDEFSADLVSEPLVLDRNALVVRAGHPILEAKEGLYAGLSLYPWLVQSECTPMEALLRRQVREHGSHFTGSVIRTDSFHFFRTTLLASDCVGLTRYDAARLEQEAGNVIEIPLGADAAERLTGSHMIGIVYRRGSSLSMASQALVREIRKLTGEVFQVKPAPRGKVRGNKP